MTELWQKSRCDDGSMMIHTEGDVMAFVDTNKGSPEDEATADRIITAVNAYDKQRALIETLEAEVERLRQREDSAREFVKRHPSLSLIDLAEFEAFLKLPEILGPRIDEAMAAFKKETTQ